MKLPLAVYAMCCKTNCAKSECLCTSNQFTHVYSAGYATHHPIPEEQGKVVHTSDIDANGDTRSQKVVKNNDPSKKVTTEAFDEAANKGETREHPKMTAYLNQPEVKKKLYEDE